MSIREDISAIIGYYIPEHQWEQKFAELDAAGKITNKPLISLIVYILMQLENLERQQAEPPLSAPQPDTESLQIQIDSLKDQLTNYAPAPSLPAISINPVIDDPDSIFVGRTNDSPRTRKTLPKT